MPPPKHPIPPVGRLRTLLRGLGSIVLDSSLYSLKRTDLRSSMNSFLKLPSASAVADEGTEPYPSWYSLPEPDLKP